MSWHCSSLHHLFTHPCVMQKHLHFQFSRTRGEPYISLINCSIGHFFRLVQGGTGIMIHNNVTFLTDLQDSELIIHKGHVYRCLSLSWALLFLHLLSHAFLFSELSSVSLTPFSLVAFPSSLSPSLPHLHLSPVLACWATMTYLCCCAHEWVLSACMCACVRVCVCLDKLPVVIFSSTYILRVGLVVHYRL